jgi:hypothetical protein
MILDWFSMTNLSASLLYVGGVFRHSEVIMQPPVFITTFNISHSLLILMCGEYITDMIDYTNKENKYFTK